MQETILVWEKVELRVWRLPHRVRQTPLYDTAAHDAAQVTGFCELQGSISLTAAT
jgi:hypothetical protein